MPSIRIESITDPASDQVYAEIHIDGRDGPVLRSRPAFASHDDMVDQVLGMFRAHFPDHFPLADDPTIGI